MKNYKKYLHVFHNSQRLKTRPYITQSVCTRTRVRGRTFVFDVSDMLNDPVHFLSDYVVFTNLNKLSRTISPHNSRHVTSKFYMIIIFTLERPLRDVWTADASACRRISAEYFGFAD